MGSGGAKRLLRQVDLLRAVHHDPARRLAKRSSATFAGATWRPRLKPNDNALHPKPWEIGVPFALRHRRASGDIRVNRAGQFGPPDRALPHIADAKAMPDPGLPLEPSDWVSGCTPSAIGCLWRPQRGPRKRALTRERSTSPAWTGIRRSDPGRQPTPGNRQNSRAPLRVDAETGFADGSSDLRNASPPNDSPAILTQQISDGMTPSPTRMARTIPSGS